MQTKYFLSGAALAALSAAQSSIDQSQQITNVDSDSYARVVADEVNFIASLATNTQFASALDAAGTALPSAVQAQVSNDPDAFFNAINTGYQAPTWITAIPTPVLQTLQTILAKPNNADNDVYKILTQAPASSVLANTLIPTSAQSAIYSDPLGQLVDVAATLSVIPWATKLPGSVQSQIGSIVNQALQTIATDFESGAPAPTPTLSRKPSSGAAAATGTLTTRPSVASGTNKPSGTAAVFSSRTGAPVAFTGAASPMRTAAAGLAMAAAGVMGALQL